MCNKYKTTVCDNELVFSEIIIHMSIPIHFYDYFSRKIIYGYPHLCGQEVYVKHICEAKIFCPNRDVI